MFNSTTLFLLYNMTSEPSTANRRSLDTTVPPRSVVDLNVYLTWRVSVAIMYWAPYLLCGLGTLGNTVSIMVMSRQTFRGRASFYPKLLAILDTCVLWTFVFSRIGGIYRGGFRTLWGCRWYLFFASFFTMSAIWTVVLLTTDRFIVIVFPLGTAQWSSMKSAWTGTSIMILVTTGFNMHWLWTGSLIRRDCQFDYVSRGRDFLKYWAYLDSSVTFYIPIILVSVLNTAMRIRLNNAIRIKAAMAGVNQEQVENYRQMTIMLFTVSLAFVVLLLPIAVYSITESHWLDVSTPHGYALGAMVQALSLMFQWIQHSTNFFLYFVSGRKFREELLIMISCKCKDVTTEKRQSGDKECQKRNTNIEGSSGSVNSSEYPSIKSSLTSITTAL